jgi:hypothetical protein
MPTQEEIDDVLTKKTNYQTKKGVAVEAERISQLASNRATAAKQAWDAAVDDGEDDEEKLTAILNAVVETGQDANAKQEDASTKSTQASQAQSQMNDAISLLINPPVP